MSRIVPYTKNREVIYDLLTRAKRFHSTLSTNLDIDATEVLAALDRARAAGRKVGFLATLVKATSLVLRKHPRLNHHLFHGLFRKYEVDFEEVACQIIILREAADGERILLPLVFPRSDELSVDEIHAQLVHHQTAPLAELPQIEAVERIKKLPRLALKYFSYKCRSDHRFYRRYFGTFGLSPLILEEDGVVKESVLGTSGHSVANTGCAFFPFAVGDQPAVVGGEVVPRKILSMMMAGDHFLVDGHDLFRAAHYLRLLFAHPGRLGLPLASDGADGRDARSAEGGE
jgi:hypothetical protein